MGAERRDGALMCVDVDALEQVGRDHSQLKFKSKAVGPCAGLSAICFCYESPCN